MFGAIHSAIVMKMVTQDKIEIVQMKRQRFSNITIRFNVTAHIESTTAHNSNLSSHALRFCSSTFYLLGFRFLPIYFIHRCWLFCFFCFVSSFILYIVHFVVCSRRRGTIKLIVDVFLRAFMLHGEFLA